MGDHLQTTCPRLLSLQKQDEKESDLYTISFSSLSTCAVEETVERPS